MSEPTTTIRPLFATGHLQQVWWRQVRQVLLIMVGLTSGGVALATWLQGPQAWLPALCGGLSQMAACWAYARIAPSGPATAPGSMAARHSLAEALKLVVALLLLVAGLTVFRGPHALVFLLTAAACALAYWLALFRSPSH